MSRGSRTSAIVLSIMLLTVAIALAYASSIIWVTVMLSAAIAYGFLSPIVAARRLYFLAGALPHSALLAAIISIPLARVTPVLSEYFWAILVGLLLTYIVGYMIHSGIDPDVATASFVSFTASASVVSIYFVLTAFPVETNITAIIIGDPLLASYSDALFALAVALAGLLFVSLTYCEQVCIGVDRDSVRLTGINMKFYDIVVFTLLAITTVALIKIVGFVLEHVLILLPASIAITVSNSSREALFYSIFSSIIASLGGLYLAITVNTAPAGVTGFILLSLYIVAMIIRRR